MTAARLSRFSACAETGASVLPLWAARLGAAIDGMQALRSMAIEPQVLNVLR
jgi:hypothetical protein